MDALIDAKKAKHRPLLGELLLQQGALTREGLQSALTRQRETGERLGRILLDMGLVTEDAYLEAMNRHLGIPYLRFPQGMFPERLHWVLAAYNAGENADSSVTYTNVAPTQTR